MTESAIKNSTDTIVAIATAAGRAGIGVIRLSGTEDLQPIAHKLLGRDQQLTPRRAHYGRFVDSEGATVDQGLLLYFPSPHSFTGENVLEIQGHGGPLVLDLLIKRCIELGARLARPGEFSERAFLNDKLDLVQAEAIADLIDAASARAVRSANRSLQGEFSKQIHQLVERMTQLRVYIEAAIDFPEEEIDFLADDRMRRDLSSLADELQQIKRSAQQGALLRDGITVVLAGKPNAGKSSLLNALAKQDRAIVTPIAGTTRDVLRERITVEGVPLNIVDTAGLRATQDSVEQQGVLRAWQEIETADVVLLVVDVSDGKAADLETLWPEYLQRFPEDRHKVMVLFNKIDLCVDAVPAALSSENYIPLSAKTGAGIDLLRTALLRAVGFQEFSEDVFCARRRHIVAVSKASDFVSSGIEQLLASNAGELLAEDLRQAQQSLGEITGEVTPDDLLGHIFSSFCIGK